MERHRVWLFPRAGDEVFSAFVDYDHGDERAAQYEAVLRQVAASVETDPRWRDAERAERLQAAQTRNQDLALSLFRISTAASPAFALVNPFGVALVDVRALGRDAMLRCDAERALQALDSVGAATFRVLKANGALILSRERWMFFDVDPRRSLRRAAESALRVAAIASELTSSFCPADAHFVTVTIHRASGFGADPDAPPTIEGDPMGELEDLLRLQGDAQVAVVISAAASADLDARFVLGRRLGSAAKDGDSIGGVEIVGVSPPAPDESLR